MQAVLLSSMCFQFVEGHNLYILSLESLLSFYSSYIKQPWEPRFSTLCADSD